MNNTTDEDQLEVIQPSHVSPSTLSYAEKVENGKTLAQTPEFLKALKLFSTLNVLDQETAQIKDENDEAGDTCNRTKTSLEKIEKVKASMGGNLSGKPVVSSEGDLATDTDHNRSASEPLKISLKINSRQFQGLLTPEGTPEPNSK